MKGIDKTDRTFKLNPELRDLLKPVTDKCGVTEKELEIVIKYLGKMDRNGVEASKAGVKLRKILIALSKEK